MPSTLTQPHQPIKSRQRTGVIMLLPNYCETCSNDRLRRSGRIKPSLPSTKQWICKTDSFYLCVLTRPEPGQVSCARYQHGHGKHMTGLLLNPPRRKAQSVQTAESWFNTKEAEKRNTWERKMHFFSSPHLEAAGQPPNNPCFHTRFNSIRTYHNGAGTS